MKRIFLFILCCIASHTILHATEANICYEVDTSSVPDTILIWIEEGCEMTDTIPLADLVGESTIYGDGYKATESKNINYLKGSNLYNDTCNMYVWGYGDKEPKVCVKINISNANKPFVIIKLDKNKKITRINCIIKIKEKATNISDTTDDNSSVNQPTMPSKDEVEKHRGEKMNTPRWLIIWMSILSAVTLILCIFVSLKVILYKKNHENLLIKVDNLSRRIGVIEKQIFTEEQVRQLITDIQKQTDTEKGKEIKQISSTTNAEKARTQPLPTKPKEPKVELLDTTDVECNWENDFLTIQHNEKPMFRIYQKGNIFYYTLIDEIKKDMPSMLGGTEQFISVNRSTSAIPRGVEIVKEGIVFNEGNGIFRVDPNNKLVINII